jgi:hypothetical protein
MTDQTDQPVTATEAAAVAQAGGTAAAQGVDKGLTRDEIREMVREAMAEQNAQNTNQLPAEQIKEIADQLITHFEERGAFDGTPTAGGPPTVPASPGSAPPSPGGGDGAVAQNVGVPVRTDDPPRNRSLADRFLGS